MFDSAQNSSRASPRPYPPPQAKSQTADFGDVQRELSSRWKELGSDDADRAKFERLAAEDRARFARESAAKDLEVCDGVMNVCAGRKAAAIQSNPRCYLSCLPHMNMNAGSCCGGRGFGLSLFGCSAQAHIEPKRAPNKTQTQTSKNPKVLQLNPNSTPPLEQIPNCIARPRGQKPNHII